MNNGKTGGTTDNKEQIIAAATKAIIEMLDSIQHPIKSWSVTSKYGLDYQGGLVPNNEYNGTATFFLEINGGETDRNKPETFVPFVPPLQPSNPMRELTNQPLEWVDKQLRLTYLMPLHDAERGHMAAHIPLVTGKGVSQHYLKMSDPELIEQYRSALLIQRERILENITPMNN